MDLVRRFIREDEGQDTVEYALVLGLIAIAAVAGISLVGSNLSTWWDALQSYVSSIPLA